MQVVAVGWQVFLLTGDPADLGACRPDPVPAAILLMLVVGQG
ncbi:MAG: hypothetical protein R3E68_04680 [Burkholderiaceae bacterium]